MKKTRTTISRFFNSTEVGGPYKSIMFINKGTSIVNVNNYILEPGEQYADNGNENEENHTLYRVNFIGPGSNNLFVFINKYV